MIHLVLDSSIFRKSPRLDSPEFAVLSEMMEAEHVTLHVPYVVEKEIISTLKEHQNERLSSAISNITKALQYKPQGGKSQKLGLTLERLTEDLEELVAERVAAWRLWMDQHGVVRHAITLEQSTNALEAYFNGNLPLKQPKSRKDIPDSFIFQQIVDLKKCYDKKLVVVVEDGALRNACESVSIICWKDLLEFFTSPSVQEFFSEKIIRENDTNICEHVVGVVRARSNDIAAHLEQRLLSDEYKALHGINFPGEDGEIYLTGINAPHSIEVEEIEYIGKRIFIALIRAEIELMYEFSLPIFDAIELDREKYSTSPLNDHYSEVETEDIFCFSARLVVEFAESVCTVGTLEELKLSLQEPSMQVDELQDFELMNDSR